MSSLAPAAPSIFLTDEAKARLKRRYRAERRFRLYGQVAIFIALAFLAILVGRIAMQGYSTFFTHSLTLQVRLDPARIDRTNLAGVNWDALVGESILRTLGETDDDLGEKGLDASQLASREFGFQLLDRVRANPALIGQTVTISNPVSSNSDLYFKGEIRRAVAEGDARPGERLPPAKTWPLSSG
jgi:phosphate transport system permease protein